MKKILNPGAWLRALRQPLVLAGLAVDLFPIYGVIAFGWNAVPRGARILTVGMPVTVRTARAMRWPMKQR